MGGYHYRRRFWHKVFIFFNYAGLFLLALATLYPFWYIVMLSLTDPLYQHNSALLWPKGFYYANYMRVLAQTGIGRAYLISILRVVVGVPLMIIVTGAAGFALTRRELKGRKTIILFYFVTMFISGGLIPYYMVLKTVGLVNTFWVYAAIQNVAP